MTSEIFDSERHKRSAHAILQDVKGNFIDITMEAMSGQLPVDNLGQFIEDSRESFIEILEQAVVDNAHSYKGVDPEDLTDILQEAQEIDWGNRKELEKLSTACDRMLNPGKYRDDEIGFD